MGLSGADREYARLRLESGILSRSLAGYDGARLEQLRSRSSAEWVLDGDDIDLTGVVDCTIALKKSFTDGLAAGAKRFVGVHGATYKVSVPYATSFVTFTGTVGITVDMSNSVLDNSSVSYAGPSFTNIFLLDGAIDTTILLRRYIGFTLVNPTADLGYVGPNVVRAINSSRGVVVRARIDNARYGVQTGAYEDGSKGGCSNFDLKLTGSMIGYPLAAYNADHIIHDIDVDGVHRAVYIAGCNYVSGVARWKDQYIADTAYLITDCLMTGSDTAAQADPVGAATTSRGCTNVDIVSIDKGSTVFQPSTLCAGISLSRVDPCKFSNIKVKVYSKGNDTISTRVGGWRVVSGAKAIWSRYPFNWEPTIVLENIEVSGVIDHSAATTVGNSGSEFYMFTYESTTAHSATVREVFVNGFVYIASPGNENYRQMYFHVPGLSGGGAVFEGFNTPGVDLALFTNSTSPVVLERCIIDELQDAGVGDGCLIVLGPGTVITKKAYTTSLRTQVLGGIQGGVGPVIKTREITLTLAGASTTWTGALPNGILILGVQGRVQTTITGATGYQVGVTGTLTKYVDTNTLTSGSTFNPANASVAGATPHPIQATTDIIVTAKTSNFTGGTLRLVVTYMEFPAPTS